VALACLLLLLLLLLLLINCARFHSSLPVHRAQLRLLLLAKKRELTWKSCDGLLAAATDDKYNNK